MRYLSFSVLMQKPLQCRIEVRQEAHEFLKTHLAAENGGPRVWYGVFDT